MKQMHVMGDASTCLINRLRRRAEQDGHLPVELYSCPGHDFDPRTRFPDANAAAAYPQILQWTFS